jgi:transcriptional regulator with XRE-family HTH domain
MEGTVPGKRLEAILHERHMTQSGLARRLGVTQAYVSALVRGQKRGSLDTWGKIADALGVDLSELVSSGAGQSAVTIAGVAVTGPADKLAEILAGMAALSDDDAIALASPEMQEPKARPSERHTGLHVLLDAVDAGEFEARYGFPLAPNDELGLRTYGRSGPVVTTEAEALDAPSKVLRVRARLTERLPVGV